MVSIPQLQEYMIQQLSADREVKEVRVEGDGLEETLRQGAIELGLPVRKVEYEVLQTGSKGVFRVGAKPWALLVYEAGSRDSGLGDESDLESFDLEDEGEEVIQNADGAVYVKLTNAGAMLKVTKPVGIGERATARMALNALAQRGVEEFDQSLVNRAVKRADEEYIRVGDYDFNPAVQSVVTVDVTEVDMKAYMTVSQPGPGAPDITADEIVSLLEANGVVHGVDEDLVREFEESPRYNEPILAAEGSPPQNGQDARVVYNFATDHSIQLKEKGGKVDFKEINLIENVEAGQILARKSPATEGEEGRTVTGRILPARAGKDAEFDVGSNVKISDDGLDALSEINGQVLLTAGKIHVEPIYTVGGDVNLHTGNIIFLGTVVVRGNVEDGFAVKAAGNIEVMGSVGKCELDAEGDIRVHQGINGKGGGSVKSAKNVFAKFINSARIQAEEDVFATDGIMHAMVDSNTRIICHGRRAVIVGGKLRAAEEINAKTLGSVAGTETILEVGYDPKRKEQLTQRESRKEELEKELREVELSITTLANFKKTQKKLPEEKAESLKELTKRRVALFEEIKELNTEIGKLQSYLSSLGLNGRVSASDRVYPGVKVFIKNESLVVRSEFKKVTFLQEGKQVRVSRYEPVADIEDLE